MSTIKNSVIAMMVLFTISNANATIKNPQTAKFNIDKPAINLSEHTINFNKTDSKLNAVFEN